VAHDEHDTQIKIQIQSYAFDITQRAPQNVAIARLERVSAELMRAPYRPRAGAVRKRVTSSAAKLDQELRQRLPPQPRAAIGDVDNEDTPRLMLVVVATVTDAGTGEAPARLGFDANSDLNAARSALWGVLRCIADGVRHNLRHNPPHVTAGTRGLPCKHYQAFANSPHALTHTVAIIAAHAHLPQPQRVNTD
jgi:hypothetical protein